VAYQIPKYPNYQISQSITAIFVKTYLILCLYLLFQKIFFQIGFLVVIVLLYSCNKHKSVDNQKLLAVPYGDIKTVDQLVNKVAGTYHCKTDTIISSVQSGNTYYPGPNEDLQVIRESDSSVTIRACSFVFFPTTPSIPSYSFVGWCPSEVSDASFFLANDSIRFDYTVWHMAGGSKILRYSGKK
jgi:hypothetical protein